MVRVIERAIVLSAVLLCACGGSQKPADPPKSSDPAPGALAPVEAAPDLSPVAAPLGLFVVGRLKTPVAVVDRIGGWLGMPGPVFDLIPGRARELVRLIDREAPVEVAATFVGDRKNNPFAGVVSVGLTSLAAAVEGAAAQGVLVTRVSPGVVALDFGAGPRCVAAVALGRAPARLVCAEGQRDLDLLLPFATRGLPNLELGQREIEISVNFVPVVESFQDELDGARLFAGFLLRRVELDAPRFDRALAAAVNGLTDDLVLLARDADKLRIGGTVNEQRGEIALDFDLELKQQKSLIASMFLDMGKRSGPAPAALFTLPGDVDVGTYSYGVDRALFSNVQTSIAEVVDAFLEHEKVGKPGRDRARGIIDAYFELVRPSVAGWREDSVPSTPDDKAPAFGLILYDEPPKALSTGLADLNGLVGDRGFRAMLKKRLGLKEKVLPKARFVPLRGPSIPAGTRALVLTIPKELADSVEAGIPLARNRPQNLLPESLALVVAPNGSGTVVAYASTPAELAKVLGGFLSGKGPTLAERPELQPLRNLRASGAYFATVSGLIAAFSKGLGKQARQTPGQQPAPPLVVRIEAIPGPARGTRVGVTVPRALFQAIPSQIATLAAP